MEAHLAITLFLALGIIIVASRIGGFLAQSLSMPRVLGELIAGVILGPTVLNLMHIPLFTSNSHELETTITVMAELGVLLLMFLIGLEVNIGDLSKVGGVAVFAGILGALLPIALSYLVITWFGFGWQQALFIGVALAATSVSISAQVLLELGFLHSREGNALLATALVDDVLAIILVSVTVAFIGTNDTVESASTTSDIPLIVLRMLAYIVIAFVVSWFGLPKLMNKLAEVPNLQQTYGVPAYALICALVFGWMAEAVGGVAVITGSFIAGVGLSRAHKELKHEIETGLGYVAYTLLVPVFFINVGLETNLRQFSVDLLPITAVLLAVAVISKIGGCGIGARLGGFTSGESFRVGVCMISRGEVGLIIAALGLHIGLFKIGDPLFSVLFMVILLSTLITPVLVRFAFPKEDDEPSHYIKERTAH